MSQTPREMWIAALRSGDFVQGKGVLTDGQGRMCCLGVGCKLYQTVGPGDLIETITQHNDDNGVIAYDGQSYHLPPKVQDWLGMADCSGRYSPLSQDFTQLQSLVRDNDGGKTFGEIADIIENTPALFR